MKRLLELAWALLCAWMIHDIYTAAKERAAASEVLEDGQGEPVPSEKLTAQPAAEKTIVEEEPGSTGDKTALKIAGVVLVLSIVAVFLIDPREFTRDGYLAAVAAVAGLTGLVLGGSRIVERFEPESRFFVTFERCLLVIGVLWASVAALAAARAG